jgi:WD40 repeat protein
VLAGKEGPIETLTFSPTGNLLATAQQDGTVTLWDPVSGRTVRTLTAGSQPVYGVAFSPDAKILITAAGDGSVTFWSAVNGRRVRSVRAGRTVNAVAVNRSGTLLAVAARSRVVLYGMRSGRVERVLEANAGQVQTVAFSPDGRMLAAGTVGDSNYPPAVPIWDTTSGRLLKLIGAPNAVTAINAVAFSPDGDTLASGGATLGTDASLILWDARPAPGFRVLRAGAAVNGVAFSPNGEQVAATGIDDKVIIWDLRSGRRRTVPGGGGGEAVAFSPDGRTLAVGAADATVTLFDAATGRQLKVMSGHTDAVFSVAFSPNGKLLASGSADQKVIIWNLSTGKPMRVLPGHTAQVNAVAFSQNGSRLAAAGNDNLIIVWNVATGRRELTLTATRPVDAVAFSPNGHILASAGADQVVSLWDLSTGQLIGAPLAGHQDIITSLVFSRDGRYLVSGSGDRSVLVWDVSSGLAVPIGGHAGGINGVALSPVGPTVASGGMDGTVTLAPMPFGMDANAISQRLCQVIRRNLTPVEWRQFVPDEPYQRTCQT